MCEHGNRIVARTEKNGTKTVLAAHFNVRKSRCLRDNASVVRLQQLGVRDLGVSGVPCNGVINVGLRRCDDS